MPQIVLRREKKACRDEGARGLLAAVLNGNPGVSREAQLASLPDVHLLGNRVEQHKDRQKDEEPNRCLIGSREFAVRIGIRCVRCGGRRPSGSPSSGEATEPPANRGFRRRPVRRCAQSASISGNLRTRSRST